MRIYVSHAKKFDYKNELYRPLRGSSLNNQHEIVLPHEESDEPFNSKEFMQTCDLMIAEVTHRATGLGIELGWADAYDVPVIGIYRSGTKVAGSVRALTERFVEYSNGEELISGLEREIQGVEAKLNPKA